METFNITADKRRSSFSLFHSHQCFFLLPVFHVSFLLDPSVIVYYSVLAIGLSGFCWYAVLITNWDSLEVQVCHFAEAGQSKQEQWNTRGRQQRDLPAFWQMQLRMPSVM